jgi:hypothetical protein
MNSKYVALLGLTLLAYSAPASADCWNTSRDRCLDALSDDTARRSCVGANYSGGVTVVTCTFAEDDSWINFSFHSGDACSVCYYGGSGSGGDDEGGEDPM